MERLRVLLIFCLVSAAVGSAATATAQLEPAGARIRISEPGLLVGYPAVAFDPRGRALVVWNVRDPTNLLVDRILARPFEIDGQPAGAPRAVDGLMDNPLNEACQNDPDVAAVAPGRFVVVWSRWSFYDTDPRLAAYDVFGVLTDAAARPLGSLFLVNERTLFWQTYPAVTRRRDGQFLVAWATGDVGDQGPWPEILGARAFRRDGVPAGEEIQVNRRSTSPTDLLHFERSVTVATNKAGESLVVWLSNFRIFARRYDRHGQPLGPEVRVDPDERRDFRPAVTAANGRFVVLWETEVGGGLMARSYDRRGIAGPTFAIGPKYSGSPAVTSDAGGRVVAAWTVTDARGQQPRIVLSELARDGSPRGDVVGVSPGRYPDLAVSPDGDVFVVWRGGEPGTPDQRVHGKRFRLR